ncbi:MAG TPA: S41 family peptidase [Candidatus Sulfomarinibacteraceae bacterium]|nr:S41 family peptidase [Candidatus Sulfomarinibacteraceae bacterium]
MLPEDPARQAGPDAGPNAGAGPSPGPLPADAPVTPSEATGPAPTGLVAGSPTGIAPVPVPARARRRGGVVLGVAIALVAVLGGSALFMSGFVLGQRSATQPGTPAAEDEAFQPFWDAYRAIRDRFALGPVDRKAVIEGAIRGMVEAIGDPYSTYLSSEEFRATLQDISGEFEGIGAEIGTVDAAGETTDCAEFGPDCRLVIVAPLEGSPAEKAGLRPGDVVAKVDGSTLDGLSPDEARDRIRGKKGTVVTLTIERAGRAAFDVEITRDVIHQREVIVDDLAGGEVAYVRLTGFSENGADRFVDAVRDALEEGRTKLIVDLRGNPGGFVTAARTVASAFIADGPIFWEEDAQGNQTPTETLGDGIATDPELQVVVLIDRGSASASEIVAGALQDTDRATIIGETSYGKGTVQQWIELESDTGGMKLTVAKWLTPDKRWIHRVGVVPDIVVEVPAETPAGSDPVLDRAVEFLVGTSAIPVLLQRAA